MAAVPGSDLLFGGFDGSYLADTWLWNGTMWSQQSVTGPSARSGTTLVPLQ